MKILENVRRCSAVTLTLVLAFIMMASTAPVYAEDLIPDNEVTDIDIRSTNKYIYYQVILYQNDGGVETLSNINNSPCTIRLNRILSIGDRVVVEWGYSADNLIFEVEVCEVENDNTISLIFNLDDYISNLEEEETPPLIEGVVDNITVINTNPDVYYGITIHHGNSVTSGSYVNYTRIIDLIELEVQLREGDTIILHYLDGDENSGEIELDPTKEVFNLDEYLGYEPVELKVVSSTDAAKTTQFYLCLGDMYSDGEEFTDNKFEALVYTGSLNIYLDKKVLEDGTPFIQLLDENSTKIEFETLEDGNFYINLDNYVKTDGSQKTSDDQKTDDGQKTNDSNKLDDKSSTIPTKASSSTTTTSSSPKTGDESNPLLATFGMISGLGIIAICLIKAKKRKIN